MGAVLWLVDTVIQIFQWILIAYVIISWLVNFKVLDTRNPLVNQIGTALYRMTEPVLRPIRNILPNLGGIDISPIILILIIFLIERVIILYLYPNVF